MGSQRGTTSIKCRLCLHLLGVNILRNPAATVALAPGRFDHQAEVLAAAASLERRRLLDWTLAFAGLSAAWHLADGTPADLDFAIAALAAA